MSRNKSVILNLFQDLKKMLNQVQHDRIVIILLLVIALFLRLYRLDELMPFIGDFAWFYLSASDMLLTGEIPLVGIASSHTWVHQGPLWTYLLAIPLLVSGFNPLSGAYLTTIAGTATAFFMYKVGAYMFSRFVGFTAAALHAVSPLAVIHSRTPYHTSLIALSSLFFIFFLYKWIRGDVRFFPLVIFALGILYNLELATMVFWILLLLVCVYGLVYGKTWFKKTLKPKIIFISILLLFFVMSPMIVYDFKENTGFYQTTAFFRLIKIYLFSSNNTFSFEAMQNVFSSLFLYNQRLIFLGNGAFALLLTVVSFVLLVFAMFRKRDSGLARMTNLLLLLWIAIPLCGILISKTASEAYIPMIFLPIIFSIALLFNHIYKRYAFVAVAIVVFVAITNSYLLITKNYLLDIAGGYGMSFSKRLSKAQEIVNKSNGREYNLIGKGNGSEHKSFTMNYEFLTWWLGHGPSEKFEKLKFIIEEN